VLFRSTAEERGFGGVPDGDAALDEDAPLDERLESYA